MLSFWNVALIGKVALSELFPERRFLKTQEHAFKPGICTLQYLFYGTPV